MNPTIEFSTKSTIESLVPKVIATMSGLTASPAPDRPPQAKGDQVSGTVGIAGETVIGAVYIHLPDRLACEIANAMLGNPADQAVGDGDLNDVVGSNPPCAMPSGPAP
jgi:CheY-specific phosphatase CheX